MQVTQLTKFLAFPARKQMVKELVRGNEHAARLEFTSVFLTKAIDDVYTLLACHSVSLAKCCGCWIIPKQGVLEPHPSDPGVRNEALCPGGHTYLTLSPSSAGCVTLTMCLSLSVPQRLHL